ncbi:50S ribosomal protein L11 methyltransferase [bacterium]|nr:50S ribosomal protein L11 methyltransferase [bacterium]
MKIWPLVIVHVPSTATREQWELFCADALEAGCTGFEERDSDGDGLPESMVLFFPCRKTKMPFEGEEPGEAEIEGAQLAEKVLCAEAQVSPHWRRIVSEIARKWLPEEGLSVHAEALPDQKWGQSWVEFYKTTRASDRIFVGPPRNEKLPEDAPSNAIRVQIEYDQVFGTGTHETTRLCLRLIEAKADRFQTLLDIGTGTGVLCFAAIKLGYEYAIGLDSDSLAKENFQRNAKLNDCEEETHFILGDSVQAAVGGALLAGRSIPELVVCNMLSDAFDPLLLSLRKLRRPMILSGYLLSELEILHERFAQTGWRLIEEHNIEEWGACFLEPDAGFQI